MNLRTAITITLIIHLYKRISVRLHFYMLRLFCLNKDHAVYRIDYKTK